MSYDADCLRPSPRRATYTVDETMEKTGLGRNATYQAIARGEIPHVRFGKRILVLAAPLHRMLGEDA